MLRSEKRATPFAAVTVVVPDSLPGMKKPPLRPVVIVTGPLKVVAWLPWASSTVTCTPGRMATRGSVVLGWTVNASCSAGLSASTPLLRRCIACVQQSGSGGPASPMGQRDDGNRRREAGEDADDPPLRFRIAFSRHLNAIAGADAELVQRRAPRDRRLERVPAPQRRVASDGSPPIDAGILGGATREHQRLRQHQVDGNGIESRPRHLADDGHADQGARLQYRIIDVAAQLATQVRLEITPAHAGERNFPDVWKPQCGPRHDRNGFRQ